MSDNESIVVKVGGELFGRQFLIEYDGKDVIIDGVRCAPEILSQMFTDPQPDRWTRFEREGDVVTCHTARVPDSEKSDPWAWMRTFEVRPK